MVAIELSKTMTPEKFLQRFDLLDAKATILNAGSSSTRFGARCLNVDVQQKENVDLVCDLHELPNDLGPFDAVICNAVLQYCRDPRRLAERFDAVLKPGGLLFVDAPWVQPFCPDTPDLYRFSESALRNVFDRFEILESGPSIRSGSALRMLAVHIAKDATRSKHVNYGLALAASALFYPFSALTTRRERHTAGAFYLIARKPTCGAAAARPRARRSRRRIGLTARPTPAA